MLQSSVCECVCACVLPRYRRVVYDALFAHLKSHGSLRGYYAPCIAFTMIVMKIESDEEQEQQARQITRGHTCRSNRSDRSISSTIKIENSPLSCTGPKQLKPIKLNKYIAANRSPQYFVIRASHRGGGANNKPYFASFGIF